MRREEERRGEERRGVERREEERRGEKRRKKERRGEERGSKQTSNIVKATLTGSELCVILEVSEDHPYCTLVTARKTCRKGVEGGVVFCEIRW